jgi:hypothetical protein
VDNLGVDVFIEQRGVVIPRLQSERRRPKWILGNVNFKTMKARLEKWLDEDTNEYFHTMEVDNVKHEVPFEVAQFVHRLQNK